MITALLFLILVTLLPIGIGAIVLMVGGLASLFGAFVGISIAVIEVLVHGIKQFINRFKD